MGSIYSSRSSAAAKKAVRAAAEGAAAGLIAALCAGLIFERRAVALGIAAAWLASSLGAGALIIARERSPQAFWWAFGGGMALRAVMLLILVAYTVLHPILSQAVLLVSYALGVLGFLLLEYRHVKIR